VGARSLALFARSLLRWPVSVRTVRRCAAVVVVPLSVGGSLALLAPAVALARWSSLPRRVVVSRCGAGWSWVVLVAASPASLAAALAGPLPGC
jgi:hypothetical protein